MITAVDALPPPPIYPVIFTQNPGGSPRGRCFQRALGGGVCNKNPSRERERVGALNFMIYIYSTTKRPCMFVEKNRFRTYSIYPRPGTIDLDHYYALGCASGALRPACSCANRTAQSSPAAVVRADARRRGAAVHSADMHSGLDQVVCGTG